MDTSARAGVLEVLQCRPYLVAFLVLAAALVALYWVLTNVFVLSLGRFAETLEPLNAALIALVALSTALLVVLLAYGARVKNAGRKPEVGLVGSVVGAFASACPFCQPLWMAWLGLSGSFAVLADYSVPISIAALLLLALGVRNAGKTIANKSCSLKSARN